jgi:hypothetical protein
VLITRETLPRLGHWGGFQKEVALMLDLEGQARPYKAG